MGTKLNWEKTTKSALSKQRGSEFAPSERVWPLDDKSTKRLKRQRQNIRKRRQQEKEQYTRWKSATPSQKAKIEIDSLRQEKGKCELSLLKLKKEMSNIEKRILSLDLTISQKHKEITVSKETKK